MESFTERDPFSPIAYTYEVQRVLYQATSPYQEIMVFESPFFGKVLTLDGVVQLTERDEHYYHEMLAHVPLSAHPSPRNVAIVGGGDGGTLREVLKHPEVERATLIELDGMVVDVCRDFFPALATGFDDPRGRVVVADGFSFLRDASEVYDVVLIDSTDPVGPAERLIGDEFYRCIYAKLAADGVMAGQTESIHFHSEIIRAVQTRLRAVFPIVDLYAVPIATYAGNWWSFSIASKKENPRVVKRALKAETRYYDAETHENSFCSLRVLNHLLS